MTQTRRNHHVREVVGFRLKQLIEVHLQMSLESVAEALGYSTSSTLRQACAGITSLSVEKLSLLANISTADGKRRVSIDWILTGEGAPFWPIAAPKGAVMSLPERVRTAPPDIQRQIEAFLDFQAAAR